MWKNSTARYGSLQVALHWLMLVLLVVVRIAARFSGPTPRIAPQPSAWQEMLAKLLHLALYAFMIGMPKG